METLQKEQNELQELIIARQKLETQFQENKIVQEELKKTTDESNIYKLTGGVLLPVEKNEAEINVDKRLEFIKEEIEKCEKNIQNKQTSLEKLKNELLSHQQS
ncbi:related to Prefoldin subunit 6 [Saccharomycodes ludwigii]|uniref:Related to Prefoldin subunit 6 n=1 Tax=Saccharomycodes ludwigii TaxID=36035 RepID=A0A376B4Q2_9ASCO|nr:hypothetical protein SCDLUD_000225 [Saccharomycodes ludwigii]KAH3902644.1 hypothetical protein SCDLUD_000225 [Saccharomycodes ludwigii]SSD59643.1 related to Prefoldin subunit 6 [Saccharomycodes ludwigii]